jgi:hypothetical protein
LSLRRHASLSRVRTGRDFVSRRSAYTPYPAVVSALKKRPISLVSFRLRRVDLAEYSFEDCRGSGILSTCWSRIAPMMSVLWRLFPWVLFLGGLIASGALYKDYREQVLLKEQGMQTTGKVEWTSLYSKPCSSSVRVAFADRNAKAFTKYFNVCSHQYRPGETVDVIYLPANPEVASLSAREAITSGTRKMVGMVVAVLFAVVGATLLIALRRKNARTNT